MADYLAPRRFARMFEMDRLGPPRCGSLEEQARVRHAITDLAPFDSLYDRVLFAMDRKINRAGLHFLPISIFYEHRPSIWGFSGPTSIVLPTPNDGVVPPQSAYTYILSHEIGHLTDWWLRDPPVMRDEDSASQFQWWVMNGQNPLHPVWQRLEPLCPSVVLPW